MRPFPSVYRSSGPTPPCERGPGAARRVRAGVRVLGLVALVLALVACSPGDEAPADEAPADVEPDETGPDAVEPDAPEEPTPGDDDAPADLGLDESEVPTEAPPTEELERRLPDGWSTVTVEDQQTGPFVIGAPDEAETWQVGASLEPLEAVAGETDWWRFWAPRLDPLEPGISNVRAMIVLPPGVGGAPDDDVVTLQVNVAPFDLDVEPDDAAAVAEVYETVFEQQGSEVRRAAPVAYDGPEVDEVAEVVHVLDPEVLDREVRQRFVPVPEVGALWSVQCDGPVGADVEEACDAALDAFRPPLT
jgi:hypothetical protein